VWLSVAGSHLRFRTGPAVGISPHRERSRQHRPALLALLRLQGEIVSAATVARVAFDRRRYDALSSRWYASLAREAPDR
jgi:hypothetical protein